MTEPGGRFAGRGAVITGGASGIGLVTATRMLSEGARVALWDVDQAMLQKTRAALGDRCHAVQVDVSDWQSVTRAATDSVDALGNIDIVIAGAGITGPNDLLEDYPLEAWQRVFAVNVGGVFHTCRALIPHVRKSQNGRIVMISSIAGKEGNPNASAYSASKAAVIAITKSLGKELADSSVLVNCVAPAVFKSPLLTQMSESHVAYMLSKIPLGRFGEPQEISAMICWLASGDMSFSTGAVFDVSGGRATY